MDQQEVWEKYKPVVKAMAEITKDILVDVIEKAVKSTANSIDDTVWAMAKAALIKELDNQIGHI